MLDVYTMGDVQRISPEAPVPVLRVCDEQRLPGGAGNAILNLISLGMQVVAFGRVGTDEAGTYLVEALAQEGVDVSTIVHEPNFQTPLKNRMIAAGQQLVRIDYETPISISSQREQALRATLHTLLKDIDVIAISDYAKGFLTPVLLNAIIDQACALKIPVIVDPKGRDFLRYRGATLIKPNLSEAVAAAGLGNEATLDDIAQKILEEVNIETLMITRSKEGISIFQEGKRQDYPALVHEVKDVTGAGDTVLAVIAAALANRIPLSQAAELANVAAGRAIERVGCARITFDDLFHVPLH